MQIELAIAIANESTTCFTPTRTLTFNMVGGDVGILQKILMRSPAVYPNVKLTGIYDAATENAIKIFQKQNNIVTSGTPTTTGYGVFGPETASEFTATCKKPNVVVTAPVSGSLSISDMEIDDSTWNILKVEDNELSFTITNTTDTDAEVDFDITVNAEDSNDTEPGKTHGKRTVESGETETITKEFKAEDFEIGEYEIAVTIDGGEDEDREELSLTTVDIDNDDLLLTGAPTALKWNRDTNAYKKFSFTINNVFLTDTDVEYEVHVEESDGTDVEDFSDEISIDNNEGEKIVIELDADDYEVGTYTISIEVDSDDDIEEENENNNEATFTLTITENL